MRLTAPRDRPRGGLHRLLPLAALRRADSAAFRYVARSRIPGLDETLPRLSRAANRSGLWLGISALLFATGRRSLRRAALRGLVSVAITSATVNLPMKLLFRRARPDLADVPAVRRLRRIPKSSSFPSGHSASAAAFASGVAMENTAAAAPVGILAGCVAFSRVYTGVHYPGDVTIGAAIGAAIARTTTRFWPLRPAEAPATNKVFLPERVEPSEDGAGLTVLVNAGSGPQLARGPIEELSAALPGARIVEVDPAADGGDLRGALAEAGRSSVALGVAGGDGSVNAGAEVALELRKPLMVVPSGTLNHLAAAVGIDSTADSIAAVKGGQAIGIDVARIDGRTFVNTASFGAYPELVDARERLEARIGKWPAVLVALIQVLRRSRPVAVEIDGRPTRVWMAFIGNCRYHPSGFAPSWRERFDDGLLDLRYVDATHPWARARLIASVLTGTLGRSRVYRQTLVDSLKIRSLDGPLRLARDGETFQGGEEIVVEKLDKRLVVFAPHDKN